MDISLNELYKGKPTIIKNKEFFQTKTYVEPFIERMSKITDDFRIQVKMPDQMTRDRDGNDITFNRVLVQAVLPPEHCIDDHEEVIGFLYGIDVKKPVAKIYRGYLNKACTNLTVFNPQWINTQQIEPGEPISYNGVKSLLEETNDFAAKLKTLKSTFLDRSKQREYLGDWVHESLLNNVDYGFGKVKLASSTPIKAYQNLFIDSDSEYFLPEGCDPSLFDVYNSFTQIITDDEKDLMNKFEKTMLINKLLKI